MAAAVTTILKSAKGRKVTLNHVKRIKSTITTDGTRIVVVPQDFLHSTTGTMKGVENGNAVVLGPKGGAKKVPVSKITAVTIELED